MIGPRWAKIFRDLWSNKSRTLLAILSIAIGVAGIGVVLGTRMVIARDLPASYAAINPSSATISCEPFNDDLLRVIRGMDGVSDAEGRQTLTVRLHSGENQWRDLTLSASPDFANTRINKIAPVSGAWPPPAREILIERASLPLTNAQVGDSIEIQTPEGKLRTLKIAGTVHDLSQPSGVLYNQVNGYISFDTLEWLGYPSSYSEMLLVFSGGQADKQYNQEAAARVRDRIEKSGREVYYTTVPDPGKHWFEPYMAPMTAILAVLGILALLLSCFLVINIIAALLAQQVRQVGVMKAIGARGYQIIGIYLFSVLVIGVLALVIALPLSSLGLSASVNLLTSYINFDVRDVSLPPQVILVQIALGLLVPILSAMFPILAGTRITVREAIQNYGLGQNSARPGLLDRLLIYLRGLPRPTLLSVRNTFRRKGRLALTLITLLLSSAIFISVISVYGSLVRTLDEALQYYGFDVAVFFSRTYRIEQIQSEISRVGGITTAETWGALDSRRVRPDGTESDSILLIAPPVDTQLIRPKILQGRWLDPEDENAVVVNTDVLRNDPDIQVNDEITLKIEGEKTTWRVVGVAQSLLVGPWAYTNYPYYAKRFNKTGVARAVYIVTDQHGANDQAEVAKSLESHFEAVGMHVSSIARVSEMRASMISQFNIMVAFLVVMAAILAIVGSLGLTGTMSLNVLERIREIGIMRAIGASNFAILQIFITEGVLIGLISWTLGLVLSWPLSRALSDIVGVNFLQTPLNYAFSVSGAFYWMLAVIVLSTLASIAPASSATRITVRDVLAYE